VEEAITNSRALAIALRRSNPWLKPDASLFALHQLKLVAKNVRISSFELHLQIQQMSQWLQQSLFDLPKIATSKLALQAYEDTGFQA
jgi:hypothetical protein